MPAVQRGGECREKRGRTSRFKRAGGRSGVWNGSAKRDSESRSELSLDAPKLESAHCD